jgi:hypothetical protein
VLGTILETTESYITNGTSWLSSPADILRRKLKKHTTLLMKIFG